MVLTSYFKERMKTMTEKSQQSGFAELYLTDLATRMQTARLPHKNSLIKPKVVTAEFNRQPREVKLAVKAILKEGEKMTEGKETRHITQQERVESDPRGLGRVTLIGPGSRRVIVSKATYDRGVDTIKADKGYIASLDGSPTGGDTATLNGIYSTEEHRASVIEKVSQEISEEQGEQ